LELGKNKTARGTNNNYIHEMKNNAVLDQVSTARWMWYTNSYVATMC